MARNLSPRGRRNLIIGTVVFFVVMYLLIAIAYIGAERRIH